MLNTANIYGPREFTPNEVLTACGNWGANGLNTWALPSKCNGKIDTSNYTHGGKEQATVFSAVKASIDNNLPIIIRLNSSDGKKTHFVTAIAYTGSCSSASSISVIDPAGGVIRTLEEAGTARNETVYGDYIATASFLTYIPPKVFSQLSKRLRGGFFNAYYMQHFSLSAYPSSGE